MPNSRYPKIVLLNLIKISKNPECITRYNWISLLKKYFAPNNDLGIWYKIDTISIPEVRLKLLTKYEKYLADSDISRMGQAGYNIKDVHTKLRIYIFLIKISVVIVFFVL